MQKIILLFLLLYPNSVFAQNIVITSIIDNSKDVILYAGAKNQIIIDGLPKRSLLKMAKGSIYHTHGNKYIIEEEACNNAYTDVLTITNDNGLYLKRTFNVHMTSKPSITVSNNCDIKLSAKNCLADPTLAITPDSLGYTIDSVHYYLLKKRGEIIGPFSIKGNILPTKHLEKFDLKTGDCLEFDVFARNLHNKYPSLNPIVKRIVFK